MFLIVKKEEIKQENDNENKSTSDNAEVCKKTIYKKY